MIGAERGRREGEPRQAGAWWPLLAGVPALLAAALGAGPWMVAGAAALGALAAAGRAARARPATPTEDPATRSAAARVEASFGGPRTEGTVAERLSASAAWAEARLASLSREAASASAVLDAVSDAVIVADAGGRVLMANEASAGFLDRPRDQIVGRAIEELVTQAEILGAHASAASGRARRLTVRVARSGAVRFFEASAAPARAARSPEGEGGPGEPAVVLTLSDVTQLAMAVQLRTDFVANASHELRTPLAAIRGAAETLAETAPEDDPGGAVRARLVEMVRSNVVRLEELTRDLLELSRLESADAPPGASAGMIPGAAASDVPIADVLAEVARGEEPACRARRLTLTTEVGPGLTTLRTDRRLLLLILKNLVENAVKFAYEGTQVRVTAERTGAAGARFRVIDRGIGIPLESQQRVFERFYQVDLSRSGLPARRGTGLGLAIVKHAVKTLGGSVSLESVWKEGTTVTVEIPPGA